MSIKAKTFRILYRVTPPIMWDRVNAWTGHAKSSHGQTYHGVTTEHNARPLHHGRYAEIYERYWNLDPHARYNDLRYRYYNIAMAAWLAKDVPGDFLYAGISYGVAARIVYDFVAFDRLNKIFHLIDPFKGIWDAKNKETVDFYNTDSSLVRRQYSDDAKVQIYSGLIPDALPLPGVKRLSFVSLDTGDADSEVASLPILYDQLSPGGVIITSRYGASGGEFFDRYDAVYGALRVVPHWFPSGQAVIVKPAN